MAVQETRVLPPQFIEDLATDYGKQLTALTAQPIDTSKIAPTVAAQDPLQAQAATLAQSGIGAYQPFVTAAQQAATDFGTGITAAQQLTGTGAGTGTGSIASYMSPYQQQVIDTTLAEFDRNRQMKEQGIRDQAVTSGAFGGGREGVALAEYGKGADMNRAQLQAGLLNQGFGQAQQAAQQNFLNQMGLASALPGLQGTDISRLGSLGALNQAQSQAVLDAQREAVRQAAFQPQEQLQNYGNLVTGIMGGMQGSGTVTQPQPPTPSFLQTALGAAATGAGIYGALKG